MSNFIELPLVEGEVTADNFHETWDLSSTLKSAHEEFLLDSDLSDLVQKKRMFRPNEHVLGSGVIIGQSREFRDRFRGLTSHRTQNLQKMERLWLSRSMSSREINECLGARIKHVTLAHLWSVLLLHPRGEIGFLRPPTDSNLFFLEDRKGTEVIVSLTWKAYHGGWIVCVDDLDSSTVGDRGDMVLVPTD